MVDKSVFIKIGMQNVNIKDLTEASEVIKYLIKKYSASEIIKKTGVDKNVLYRLEHQQNITLENWLKIKRCFPELFVPDNTEIGEIPIMGQLTGNKVLPLNPAQPKIFNAPKKLLKIGLHVLHILIINLMLLLVQFVYFLLEELMTLKLINNVLID